MSTAAGFRPAWHLVRLNHFQTGALGYPWIARAAFPKHDARRHERHGRTSVDPKQLGSDGREKLFLRGLGQCHRRELGLCNARGGLGKYWFDLARKPASEPSQRARDERSAAVRAWSRWVRQTSPPSSPTANSRTVPGADESSSQRFRDSSSLQWSCSSFARSWPHTCLA